MQVVQTLDKHKGYIQNIKWARENFHHDTTNPYTLRLACSDYNGKIYVWEVMKSILRSEFHENSKPIEGYCNFLVYIYVFSQILLTMEGIYLFFFLI